MHRKAISLYVVTKGDRVADVSTQRGNCLPSSKTLNCICATISLLQTPRQAIKRQCRRMNEKYHKRDERAKLIDQGGSRGNDDTPLVQRGCTRASYSTSTYLGAPQERDKTREKPSMAHSLNCTRYAHVYANALC